MSPGERLLNGAVKFSVAAVPVVTWSVKPVVAEVIDPCRLNEPAVKVPVANSESFQAARVIAAPTPSTRPPASTARILRRVRVDSEAVLVMIVLNVGAVRPQPAFRDISPQGGSYVLEVRFTEP